MFLLKWQVLVYLIGTPWHSSITHRYLTRISGGHSYMMELLARIDLVNKGQIDGDISTIMTYGRQLLQNKFASGYYQHFPVEDRRAKEVALRTGRLSRRSMRGECSTEAARRASRC